MTTEGRLAVRLVEAAGRHAAEAYRSATTPEARAGVIAGYRLAVSLAPMVARSSIHSRSDQARIRRVPAPKRYAAMPRGAEIFRDYACAVAGEFRRQQQTFDHYAQMTALLHLAVKQPPRRAGGTRAFELDDYGDPSQSPGLVSGYTPGFDPSTIFPLHLDAYDAAGTLALRTLSASLDFHLEDPGIMRQIQALQLDRIVGIDATTRRALQDILVKGAGGTVVDLARAIEDYWDQASLRRAITIAHTEMAFAATAAERDTYRQNGVSQVVFSGNASLDDPGELDCNQYLGNVYDVNDAVTVGLIPLHPLCVVEGTQVRPAGRVIASSRARYRGPVVSIRPAGQDEVTTTPGHPVLTDRGWVAARGVRAGDHVLCTRDDALAPPIERIHAKLRATRGFALTRCGPADFHGDAVAFDGAVETVDVLDGVRTADVVLSAECGRDRMLRELRSQLRGGPERRTTAQYVAARVEEVSVGQADAWMYDLQTQDGHYAANRVVLSNCSHFWAPVLDDWLRPRTLWAGGNLSEGLGLGPSPGDIMGGLSRAATSTRTGGSLRAAARMESREHRAVATHTGVMVAFFLPLVARTALALPDGEPADDLHITLAFLGSTDDIDDPGRLRSAVASFARQAPPMAGTITGVGRFTAVPEGELHPVVALVDSPGLAEWRTALVIRLREAGFEADGTHGFLPHVTLSYVPPDAPSPVDTLPALRLRFDEITLSLGPGRETWRLEGR